MTTTTRTQTNNKQVMTLIKNLLTVAIFFIALFLNNSFGQVPVAYYSFETGSTYSTFSQTVTQTINTVSSSTFSRNSGASISSTNGLGKTYGGSRTGKAAYSTDWTTSSTDPGTSASKYYTFKVNTSNFAGIGLKFDVWSGSPSTVQNIGILYSTNGTTFYTLGSQDISLYAGSVYNMNLDFSSVTALDNKSEITFRIYGYKASSSSSYLAIDNLMVTALATTGSSTESLLSEPTIYTNYTDGLTGYVYVRKNFTVGSSSTVNITDWISISGIFTVNGTLVCGNANEYIQGYTGDSTSTFTLNSGATLKIGDPDGITTSGILGNINTLNRNFSTDAIYYYTTALAFDRFDDNNQNVTSNVEEIESTHNGFVNGAPSIVKSNTKSVKDAATANTGNGLPSTVRSLTIDNTGNISLTSSVIINNTLTLTNGVLFLGSSDLTLGASASVSGTPSSTKMVVPTDNGEFKKIFNSTGSFTFPVGDFSSTAYYTPATLTFTSGTFSNNAIGLKILTGKNPNNNSISNYLTRSWIITNYGVTNFTYNILMQYVTSDVRGNESSIYFGKYDNGIWLLLGQANATNHTLNGTNLNQFSTFTGGEQGAMPVELTSFASSVNGRDAKLSWITANEQNNQGFDIERKAINDNNWTKIDFVKGNGTVSHASNYSYTDSKLNAGKYNYRLKQIDNNGNYKYYNLSNTIEIGLPGKFNLSQNYPNPFNPTTKIDYDLPRDSKVSIKIYDLTGREVMSLVNSQQSAGNYTVQVNASKLSSGIYVYSMIANSDGNNTVISKKMNIIK